MSTVTAGGNVPFDMLDADFGFTDAESIIQSATNSLIAVQTPSGHFQTVNGTFTYDAFGISGGTITAMIDVLNGNVIYTITGFSMSIVTWGTFILNNDAAGQRNFLLAGNDLITGSAFNDRLKGFGGNDNINGGGGSDTAIFTGNRSSYTIVKANGTITVTDLRGVDGSDTLTDVEFFQFADGTIAANTMPVVNAGNYTPGHTQTSVFLSTFVTFSDADGDPLQQIEIFDNTTGGGRFRRSGVLQVENQGIVIAPADFASYEFVTDAAVTNSVSVRTFDGTSWGAWTTFNINPRANALPAITAPNLSPGKNDTFIAGANLFSAADGDGDAITRYRFYDETVGNGRFLLNGAPQVERANFEIAASDLANFGFETSPAGPSTLWVQAYDGIAWGAWKSFNVAAVANVAPIASVQNLAPAKGTAFIAGASLFTVTDPDDASMAKFRFFDGTAGNGRFQLNGLDQVELTNIEIDASDLANFRFRTSASGSDVLWVQAFDGTAWSAWKSFTVAPPANIAPVVTVQNLTPAHTDAFIAGANLFTVSDPDDASVAKYRFFDGTSGNGRFQLNGQNQVELTNIEIDAADLANFRYATSTTGAGDVLWVQAYDGFDWGTWKSFTVAAPPNALPVVTINTASLNPAHGTATVLASNFFSVTDADTDTITQYRFFDGNAGNGRFELNGVPQVELTNITVDANDLANFRYRTSATGTGDTLWVQAFDGISWSAWKSFNVAAPPNAAPVVTINQASLNPGHGTATIAASSFFSTADADNDTITQFRFFDGNAGNGRFQLNGNDQVELTNITIDASDLANFTYRTSTTGAGDTLWVQASDGTTWSAWKSFNVSAPANVAPIVNVQNTTPAVGQSFIAASALFTVTDPDDGAMVRYRFFDETVGNGRFQLNGVNQVEFSNITVEAADLANFRYSTSTAGGDTLWVQAFDGTAWSAWKFFSVAPAPTAIGGGVSFSMDVLVFPDDNPFVLLMLTPTPDGETVTTSPYAPIVTATDTAIGAGDTAAIASLLSVSDPDGEVIAAWQLWDATEGGGVLRLDGAPQPEKQAIDVMADQLAAVEFLAGDAAGDDQLWARASDGTNWGEWKPFTITTLAA